MKREYDGLAISTEDGLDALNNKLAELVEKAYLEFLAGNDFCMTVKKEGVLYQIEIWEDSKHYSNTLAISHNEKKEFYAFPSVRRCFLELRERCLVDF